MSTHFIPYSINAKRKILPCVWFCELYLHSSWSPNFFFFVICANLWLRISSTSNFCHSKLKKNIKGQNGIEVKMIKEPEKAIFEILNIQLDSEAVRTKTMETRWNECEIYLHIIHFPLSLSSLPRGGGTGGSELPVSRTLLFRFPYLYLPPSARFRAAPVPCKLAESKHILVL